VLVEVASSVAVVGAAVVLVDVATVGTVAVSSPALHAATMVAKSTSGTNGTRRASHRRWGVIAPMMASKSPERGSYRPLNLLRHCSQRHRSS
jgi:hypothetical protein